MDTPIRILLRQPALPHYRLPIFRRLANQPGVTLRVVTSVNDDIANVETPGLDSQELLYHHRTLPVAGPTYTDPGFCEAVEAYAPDVVILPWNARQSDMRAHLAWLRKRRIGSVLWGHGFSKQEQPWRRWLRNRAARQADALLFYNHQAAERCAADGLDSNRLFVAPNALDHTDHFAAVEHWRHHPEELDALAREHGLNGRQTILFISRMDPANRLDLLIDALPRVLENVPEAKLIAVGQGDEEIKLLKSRASDLGVAERVRFTGPIYDQQQLGGIMSLSRVFCYPANIGLSILHAFAFSLPVVTSDHIASHNPEIESMRDKENGLFYRNNDASDLADKLSMLLTDEQMRLALGQGALETVKSRYSPQAMVDGMLAAARAAQKAYAR